MFLEKPTTCSRPVGLFFNWSDGPDLAVVVRRDEVKLEAGCLDLLVRLLRLLVFHKTPSPGTHEVTTDCWVST
jgi:hypothetical protein